MDFPNVDPIPIPAPVWLMKGLGLLTLALHFFAMQVLIGSLVAVCYFAYRARATQNGSARTAAAVVARRLPIVMTYVINFGVPPLLFLQVLYGRAIYTSTVLIAVMWLSIVGLTMACYWLLYRVADRSAKGQPVGLVAAAALVLAASVGHIYSIAMTLMLRPEVWQDMYAKTATGMQVAPNDPSMMPRFLFLMVGGLVVGGVWIALNSGVKTIEPSTAVYLRKSGISMALLGVVIQAPLGFWVFASQPDNVKSALTASPLNMGAAGLWVLGTLLTVGVGLLLLKKATTSVPLAWLANVCAFLGIAGFTIVRDGIRDYTLAPKGYDVWNRTEVSNWFVIIVFLLLFVAGLGVLYWLLSVMKQAQAVSEEVPA